MSKRTITISVCGLIILAGTFIGILFSLAPSNARAGESPPMQEEMLDLTLEWGRLAPLPSSTSGFQINTEGGPFTRSFRASFTIKKDDLDNWIEKSPGLHDAKIEAADGAVRKYVIKPGGGAGYAEAVIDFDKCLVETYVYWS